MEFHLLVVAQSFALPEWSQISEKNYRDELNVKLYIPVQIRISGTMSPKVMIIFTGLRFVDPVGLVFVCWLFDTKGFTPQTG